MRWRCTWGPSSRGSGCCWWTTSSPQGGTLAAGARLVRAAGGEPVEACAIIELPELNGRSKLKGLDIFCLLEIEGTEPPVHEDGDTKI